MGNHQFLDTLALVDAVKRGDGRAQSSFNARFFPIAVRIAEVRLGRAIAGDQDAEDVAQESIWEALKNLEKFEPRDDASFRDWLARIVQNNVTDLRRKQGAAKRDAGGDRLDLDRSGPSLFDSIFPSSEPTPSQVARGRELDERLQKCMGELGEMYREVIVLRNMCGMDFKQIAERMGYSNPSTVRSIHTRALDKLKKCL